MAFNFLAYLAKIPLSANAVSGPAALLIAWFFSHGLKIIGILVVAIIIIRLGKVFISKYLKALFKKGLKIQEISPNLAENRIETLQKVMFSIFRTTIWLLAIITILPEFGVNIGPLLAGVGVGGLALGLAARSIIQDYFSGLFILLEDQFRVGEEIQVGQIKGKVKDFNLRRTVIKDSAGALHYISNSQIKGVANFSRK